MTPADVVELDQDRAELTALVRGAREHHEADACTAAATCPGQALVHVVCHEIRPRELRRLLLLAVAALADTGYALPTADELAHDLAATAAPDQNDGGDRG